MYSLRIDDEEVLIDEKAKIKLSLLVLDLSDLSKRGVTFTNVINLPFSSKNNRLTGYPLRVSTDSDSFEKNKSYSLFMDGNLLSEGSVIVKSADEVKGIKIQLTEGIGFWDRIGGKLLSTLDLFDYFFLINNTSLDNLRFKGSSPLLQGFSRGINVTNSVTENNVFQRPAYRHKRILEEIISQAGYSINWNNVLEVTDVDNIGVMSNAQKFIVSEFMWRYQKQEIPTGQIQLSTAPSVYSIAGNVALNGNNIEVNTYKTGFIIKGSVSSNFDTQIRVIHTREDGQKTERFNISKGFSFISFKTDSIEIGSTVSIFVDATVNFSDVRIFSYTNEVDIFEVEGSTFIGNNDSPVFNKYMAVDFNLPEQSQKEFLRDVLKMFFLSVNVDEVKREVSFSSFSDILSTNNAIDISEKVQKDGEVMSGELFGRLNTCTFSNDQDIPKEEGAYYFSINNEASKPIKNFLSFSLYSASKEVVSQNKQLVALDIYNLESRIVLNDRLVYFSEGVDGFSFRMSGATWSNFMSDNYSRFIDSTKRERIISKQVILNNLDFLSLKSKPVVYIKEYDSNFLVSNIEGFETGYFSTLKLLKFL